MAHRLATPEGKKLYGRASAPRSQSRIIKSVCFDNSCCALDKVRGEWSLVTMAWNIKRIFALAAR